MFTVCPKCALPLAVTAADLRAGQGYVRCGRCSNVFNALLGLSEESGSASSGPDGPDGLPEAEMDKASATASRPALTEPDIIAAPPTPSTPWPPSAPALRLVDSPPRPPSNMLSLETEDDEESPDDDSTTGEFRGTTTFETIVLEGDTFLQTEETIPEEVMASELADVSRRIAAANEADDVVTDDDAVRAEAEPEFAPELVALREATGEFRHVANLGVPDDDTGKWRAAARAWPVWWMTAAAVALALILTAQAVNHWRNDLATRSAWYGPLSRVAAMLGEPLHPNWDLTAYDVRQLGAAADSSDGHGLRVRLSLANVGAREQALPLLRLTLLDRYGKAVSTGELEPAQYLPSALRGQRFIRRDQRIDTEVRVLDPSRQVSSFELDVCVAAAGGGLRCAGDAPAVVAGQP